MFRGPFGRDGTAEYCVFWTGKGWVLMEFMVEEMSLTLPKPSKER